VGVDDLSSEKMGGSLCGQPEPMPPSSVLRNEPLHRLFKAVEQAFRHKALLMMRQQGIADVFPGTVPLILHLGDEDGLPMSELARRCGLDASTLTPLVDELEKRGMAVRKRSDSDRRIICLHLSPRGQEIEPILRRLIFDLQELAMQGIPQADIAAMHRVMEGILANLEE
jgi:DNA-binding MarR family transcriptional regulator